MILDTAFVVDVWDGDEAALDCLDDLERRGLPQRLSAMTVFELHYGVGRSGKPERERRRVLDVVDSKPIVAADRAVMAKAGSLHATLENDGKPIGESDCIIAATALVVEEPIVTRNVGHFERVRDLDVHPY
jgi:tRNA(fMet)-specific endonuclease VapC